MAKIDDSVKKKVPELRFKGFTDEWEERKLSTESTITAGGDIDKSKLKEVGEYPILANALTNDGIVGYYDSSYRVEAPAVTVTGRGDVGHAKARKVNFTPVVRLLSVKSKHDVDFLENAINNHKVLVESTGVPQLTAPQLGNYKIFFPTGEEQEKIGSFFKQLDDTIALHQHKLDLLKEQKKGYLQKMFPKNGAKVPELRFAGFADDWEQRKLGDISYKVKEKNKTGEFTETLTNSAEYGIINQRDFFDKDISNAKNLTGYYVVKNDDFVYNPRISNFAPVGPIKRNKLGRTGVMSPLYYVFRTHDIDKNYFEKYFDTVYWHRFMELNGDSGARADRFAIKDSVFVEMPIPYPTMDEQQKIGAFFKQLDYTIALHQRKLDLLKEQKKGFLQKMFV